MSAHSPGPWRSGRQDMVSYTMLDGEDGGPWKNIYWDDPAPEKHPTLGTDVPSTVARAYGRTEEEALANARLIAAAPELLRALGDMAVIAGHLQLATKEEFAQWTAARALIRRIEGEP